MNLETMHDVKTFMRRPDVVAKKGALDAIAKLDRMATVNGVIYATGRNTRSIYAIGIVEYAASTTRKTGQTHRVFVGRVHPMQLFGLEDQQVRFALGLQTTTPARTMVDQALFDFETAARALLGGDEWQVKRTTERAVHLCRGYDVIQGGGRMRAFETHTVSLGTMLHLNANGRHVKVDYLNAHEGGTAEQLLASIWAAFTVAAGASPFYHCPPSRWRKEVGDDRRMG